MSRDVPIWEIDDGRETVEGLDEHGEPDPAYAAALGLLPAPMGRRAAAAAIDLAGYCLLQVPYWVFTLPLLISVLAGRMSWYGFVNHPHFVLAIVMASVTAFLTLVFCIVQLVMHGRKGTTLGKGLTGIRTVNVKTLAKPGFWRVLLRVVVVLGSAVTVIGPVAFLLSPLLDPQKRGRGWHDAVGQTWLVDVRHGLQPYDEKRMRIARKTVAAAPVLQHKALPSLATPAGSDGAVEYRPGARMSAGVLGAARPHGAGERPEVGLTGLEPAATPPGQAEAGSGAPVLGGYLSSGAPAAPTPPPPVRPIGFVLRLDSGERLEVGEPLVLGRDPAPVDGARAVPVADETHSTSKTHLSLRPVGQGIEVTDQNSTNGTELVHDGVERLLEAGAPALAVPGDTIRFGGLTAVVGELDQPGHSQ